MGTKTGIEWTDATWNPILGCSRVSEGCRNCYAEAVAGRFGRGEKTVYSGLTQIVNGRSVWTGKIVETMQLLAPLRWRSPKRVFVNSMSDLFHETVTDEQRDKIFAVMALCPQHTFQVLTKRPERMSKYFADGRWHWIKVASEAIARERRLPIDWQAHRSPEFLSNVWLGVSVEDQATADARIPLLLQTPAAKRFLSCEPLLGPIKFWWMDEDACAPRGPAVRTSGGMTPSTPSEPSEGFDDSYVDLDWVIAGGESGPHARPMHPDWARSLREQCVNAGVPFFFKQWGEWRPHHEWIPSEKAPRQIAIDQAGEQVPHHVNPDDVGGQRFQCVGKKAAGALLDGRAWKEFPDAH